METHQHFSRIAAQYTDLRSTDLLPIKFIRERLVDRSAILAADIGCGAGRYDTELLRRLGRQNLFLVCIDSCEAMLGQLAVNVRKQGFDSFQVIQAQAGTLPLPPDSLDAVFTFNAVHHFHLRDFLLESARTMREGARLFIYTRFRSQNRKNIWGRFFPGFNEKETRLYELQNIQDTLESIRGLSLQSVDYFKYQRQAPLEWLETQATNCHYSTFSLYRNGEFEEAMEGFRKNIRGEFQDMSRITWHDHNVMLVFQKECSINTAVSAVPELLQDLPPSPTWYQAYSSK